HENNPAHPKRRKRRRVKINPVRFGLFLLTCFGLLGGLIFLWLASRSPLNALEVDQLDIPLAQAVIELPSAKAVVLPTAPTGELDKVTAQQLVEYWLSRKAGAFGPDHAIDSLNSVLVAPMLNQWQNRATLEKGKNAYRKYQHQVEVLDVKVGSDKNQGQILAKVKEQTSYFTASNPDKPETKKSDEITVRYQVVRQGDRWLIRRSALE
ncbi:MAG: ARC6/PARC6 family protein, partial [Microcystaceae cyanobacterium]